MVGRLVQHQDVRIGRHGAGQGGAPRLAAGDFRRVFLAGQAQALEQIVGPVVHIARRQAGHDIITQIAETAQVRLLFEIADSGTGMDEALPVIRLDQAGGDFHQRRLARSVSAHEA